jgi:hypothetical protein
MQHQSSHQQAPSKKAWADRLLLLAGLAGLLVTVALLGLWDTAWAAQQSGNNLPDLNIVGLNNNIVALSGQNWEPKSTVTLSYSTSTRCQFANSLKSPYNIAFVSEQGTIQVNYPWPATTTGGPFYFCASGRSADNNPAPGIFTPQAIVVSAAGTVSFAPGSAPTPPPTNTPTNTPPAPSATTAPPAHPTATTTPANNATATARASATATQSATATAQATRQPTASATGSGQGSPGNKGASASNKSSAPIIATFAAIVALCILVLTLLVYLIRIYLRGRQTP